MSSDLFKKITIESDKVWLVGDIHGQYDLLMDQLAKQDFDPGNGHLLVSVGDLIDRGPQSLKTLELIKQPWFHCVKGNHEQMLLKGVAAYENSGPSLDIVNWQAFNGGEWYDPNHPAAADVDILLEYVKNLPVAIEIATEQGSLGVVHAAVPNNIWLDTTHLHNELIQKHLLWFRGNGFAAARAQEESFSVNGQHSDREEWLKKHKVSGIDRVVVGHTIMPDGKPVYIGNTLYLDVGAAQGIAPKVMSATEIFELH